MAGSRPVSSGAVSGSPGLGKYLLSGTSGMGFTVYNAEVSSGGSVQPNYVALTFTAYSADLQIGGGFVEAGTAALTFTAHKPDIVAGKNILATVAGLTFTAHNAVVETSAAVYATASGATFSAFDADIITPSVVEANYVSLDITKYDAVVTSGGSASPNAASMVFTPQPAYIASGEYIRSDIAALTFTPHPPEIFIPPGTIDVSSAASILFSPLPAFVSIQADVSAAASTLVFTTHTTDVRIGRNPKLHTQYQRFAPDNLVTLFEIDATAIGGDYMRFTSTSWSNDIIRFGGNEYFPVDVEASGFEVNSRGTLPTPTLRINNAVSVLQAGVVTLEDLLGATVYRIRTFKTFLDGGDDPDPNAKFPMDVYKIERKVAQNKVYVEFELSAAIDQEGRMIPGRQIIRDYCTHVYRMWDPETETFDYSKATCPYVGGNCYDENNSGTSSAYDRCGKRLSSCKLRFGNTAQLPTRAFPGVTRV